RNIKQLGFADLAFPGATHSRYSHSLGAMEMATRIFDNLFKPGDARMRQALRLAMLLHDLGHAPLSHSTEMRMPSKKSLGINAKGQATHEDYTLKLITNSSFSKELNKLFGPEDITELNFQQGGLNYQPILKQIISSECDADRMDYLQRDSFYCGVNYGKFDADWLISSLVPIEQEGAVYLGIKSKGILSFEDFLLSRYHMFASVYLHHTPVIFEKMLQKYFEESKDAFELPSDLEEYVLLDDIEIYTHLRKSDNSWAKRITQRKPYRLLADELSIEEYTALGHKLTEQNIDFVESQSNSVISKEAKYPLYVQTKRGTVVPLESYTELFKRYQRPAQFNRIYVSPSDHERARQLS
ncbi:MAG: HD domain-containing protein, partial [Myxococcaceae bacterium]